MWFTLGFGLSAALGVYLGIPFLPWVLLTVPAALLLLIFSRRAVRVRILAVLLLGCAVGAAWLWGYESLHLGPLRPLDGTTQPVSLRATGYSWQTDYGSAVDASIQIAGRSYPVRVYFRTPAIFSPGDRFCGSFRFRLTTGGAESEPHYLRGKGIFLLAYASGTVSTLPPAPDPWSDAPAHWRARLQEILSDCFAPDISGLTTALLLGDSGGVDYALDTALKLSGVRHVIAVSGLHISILFSAVYLLCLHKRWLALLIGAPVLLFFSAIVGFTPSVTRACIMQILMLISIAINREYDPPTALCAACLVMLAVNPMVITSISFQMSVGCVAGILLFSPKLQKRMLAGHRPDHRKGKGLVSGIRRFLAGSLSVTLGSMAVTTPLCAVHFGTVSLVSPITNLLVVPIISLSFYGTLLICVLALIGIPAALPARLTAALLRCAAGISKTFSSLPLAAVYTKSVYIVAWLVFCYLLLALLLLSKRKHPGAAALCACFGLSLALLASWAEPLTDGLRVTALDVGQGQCILLQSRGKAYLVDCGGSQDTSAADLAAETLLSQGISRLDGIVLTHYDRDHSGGVPLLLSRIQADAIFLPNLEDSTGVRASIASLSDAEILPVEQDLLLTSDGISLHIYGPALKGDHNDASLAVLFQTDSGNVLITGDRSDFGERRLLAKGLPTVNVLIVGHHGSKYSTCTQLLEGIRPEVALISVSADNVYGHPNSQTLDRLEAVGCEIYRTDQCGTILYRR